MTHWRGMCQSFKCAQIETLSSGSPRTNSKMPPFCLRILTLFRSNKRLGMFMCDTYSERFGKKQLSQLLLH